MKKIIAAVVCVAAFSCGPDSRLNPDDEVTVRGTVKREDGSALGSTKVALVKEPDLGEVLTGLTAIVGSIGTACLIDDPPPLCDSAHTATTNGSGGYEFSLLGADTQGSVGQASYFNLSVRGPARQGTVAGPSRTERFVIQDTLLEPPELVLWEPEVSLASSDEGIAVTSEGLPEGASSATLAFVVPGAVLWETPFTSGAQIDGRFLEDATGTVSVNARSSDSGNGTVFEHRFESESHAFTSTTGAPPSRNASCNAVGASGTIVAIAECSLTDGEFATPWIAPADSGCVPDGQGQGCANVLANKSVAVDLGEARSTSLIVVRGLGSNQIVERSSDGETWTQVTISDNHHAFLLPVEVRYVRVRPSSETGTVSTMLREISVW